MRWFTATTHGTGDTFWYARLAYLYLGTDDPTATARAAGLADRLGIEPASSAVALVAKMDPRYPAIFAGRPLYPATGAVLIPVAGPEAMVWSAAFAGVLAGVMLGWFAGRATGSPLAGIVALLLFYALPTGAVSATAMADPWALAGWVGALVAGSLYLIRGGRGALAGLIAAVLTLALAKSANAAALAVALLATTAVLALLTRRSDRTLVRRAGVIGACAAVVTAGVLGASALLGLPGFEASLQDTFTAHFTRPTVTNPYQLLLRRDLAIVQPLMSQLIGLPGVLALGIVGLGGLVVGGRPWGALWIAAVPASLLLVLAHPVSSEIPRLMAPAWASVALGLAMWLPVMLRYARRRLPTGSAPAVLTGDAPATPPSP